MFKVGDVVQPSNQVFKNYWTKRATSWLAQVEGYTDSGKIRIKWIMCDLEKNIGMKANHPPDRFKLHMNGVERMIQVL